MKTVWVVSYYDIGEEPVVTVFTNSDAAYDCYEYFFVEHDKVSIDEVPVYKDFIVHI